MSLFCALVEAFIGDFGRETDIDVRGGATALLTYVIGHRGT
jgi:hypothetical protein